MKTTRTNAVRLLQSMGVPCTMVAYDTADGAIDGPAVAEKTGNDPARVFKTLVTQGAGGGIYVFCLPVTCTLQLKAAALAAGEKSLAMLPAARLLAATGYVHGGVSPLGMKKSYPTFLHATAMDHDTIFVSAGRIGLQAGLAPADLLRATGARLFGGEDTAGAPGPTG